MTIVVTMIGTIRLIAVVDKMMTVMIVMMALIVANYLFPGRKGIDEIGLAPAGPELGREVSRSLGFARRIRTPTGNIS